MRDDKNNILILNYLSLVFLFSLMISYKINGTLIYILFILFLFNKNFKEHLIFSLKNKLVQACIAYFLVYIVWMLGTEEISYAFAQIKINKVFLYSILFVAIIRKEFLDKFIYVFLIGLLINVIWSYLIFFGIASSPFSINGYLPLLEKTDHGFFVLIGVAYSLFRLLVFNDNIFYKILFLFFIGIETINIFITNNKTIMFLYLIIVLITLIYIYRNKIFKIIMGLFLFITLFLLILNLVLPNVKNNLLNEMNGTYTSLISSDFRGSMGTRVGIAKYALDIIEDNMFFGVGTGGHVLEIINRVNSSDLKKTNPHSYKVVMRNINTGKAASLHNTFLQVLVQFGIIGLIIFLNVFYQISKFIPGPINLSSYLLLVIVVTILLQFNTGWDFQFGNLGSFFILFVSILLSSFQQVPKDRE